MRQRHLRRDHAKLLILHDCKCQIRRKFIQHLTIFVAFIVVSAAAVVVPE